MPSALPSPNNFLTSLLSSPVFPTAPLTAIPKTYSSAVAPSSKPLLLTLHCLFPSEFLPALDLLDRRLVTRFVYLPPSSSGDGEGETLVEPPLSPRDQEQNSGRTVVYYVRSSQRVRNYAASRHDDVGTSYEVRTRAWNCTCPAFAFAAFAGEELRGLDQKGDGKSGDLGSGREWDEDGMRDDERLGGLALGSDVQVCKHLLACVLVERCKGLEEYIETRMVGRAKMAGWAAGWGG